MELGYSTVAIRKQAFTPEKQQLFFTLAQNFYRGLSQKVLIDWYKADDNSGRNLKKPKEEKKEDR